MNDAILNRLIKYKNNNLWFFLQLIEVIADFYKMNSL